MPNRIIKESICRSDSINGLSWFEEVLFYRLIVNCDDYGRFDARPAIIKGSLFPLKSVTEIQIMNALNKLSTAGIVLLYEHCGRPYLQFVTWEFHQQIRSKKSKFPEPDIICNQLISDDSKCPRNPIQSNPNPNKESAFAIPREIENEWQDYCDMRKKIKKPMTDKAALLAFNKLNALAPNDFETQKKILNQSVFNSWQGLFALKNQDKQETDIAPPYANRYL